jgi:hypothetical protein
VGNTGEHAEFEEDQTTIFTAVLALPDTSRSVILNVSAGDHLLSFVMAPSRKTSATAEVALAPLKNCLVNLPPSLVSLLVNANAVSSGTVSTAYSG